MTTLVKNSTYLAKMPETYYRTGKYIADHRTWGGEITHFDLDGHHTMSSIAKKIASNNHFDYILKYKSENCIRQKQKTCKEV